MFAPSSSEFPNDNPELGGVSWLPATVCGCPQPLAQEGSARGEPGVVGPKTAQSSQAQTPSPAAELRASSLRVAAEEAALPVGPELEVGGVQPAGGPAEQDATESNWARFVDAVVQVALDRGRTRRAAELKRLLADETQGDALSSETLAALKGWRQLLSGSSDDYAACGSRTLDEWAAQLLCELTGERTPELRQALRRRGVAAFGMLAA